MEPFEGPTGGNPIASGTFEVELEPVEVVPLYTVPMLDTTFRVQQYIIEV